MCVLMYEKKQYILQHFTEKDNFSIVVNINKMTVYMYMKKHVLVQNVDPLYTNCTDTIHLGYNQATTILAFHSNETSKLS